MATRVSPKLFVTDTESLSCFVGMPCGSAGKLPIITPWWYWMELDGVGSGCPHSYDIGVVCTSEDLPDEGEWMWVSRRGLQCTVNHIQ